MSETKPTPAQRIAQAAIAFQRECTGIAPRFLVARLFASPQEIADCHCVPGSAPGRRIPYLFSAAVIPSVCGPPARGRGGIESPYGYTRAKHGDETSNPSHLV